MYNRYHKKTHIHILSLCFFDKGIQKVKKETIMTNCNQNYNDIRVRNNNHNQQHESIDNQHASGKRYSNSVYNTRRTANPFHAQNYYEQYPHRNYNRDHESNRYGTRRECHGDQPLQNHHRITRDASLFVSNGLRFRQLGKSECEVVGLEGAKTATSVIIPAVTHRLSLTVTRIGKNAFRGAINIREISIPATCSSVGAWAFSGSTIEKIELLPSIKDIEEGAFADCQHLVRVDMARCSVKAIPAKCFINCAQLSWVRVPTELEVIGEAAFERCYGLCKIWLPDTVRELHAQAYKDCFGVKALACMSDHISVLADDCFCGLTNLETVNASAFFIAKAKGALPLQVFEKGMITDNSTVSSLGILWKVDMRYPINFMRIRNNITVIAEDAFADANYITIVFVPTSIRVLLPGAFRILQTKPIMVNGKMVMQPNTFHFPSIRYDGTIDEWQTIIKPRPAGYVTSPVKIECRDGIVTDLL